MGKYTEDKERIDKITELIANQEPVKEWVCIYWMAVAIGHILEWMVKQMKPGDINEDEKEIEQDMNITWEEFNETLSDTQKILSVVSAGTEQPREDSKRAGNADTESRA